MTNPVTPERSAVHAALNALTVPAVGFIPLREACEALAQYDASLTGRILKLEEALTPSAATKAAYIGEFTFDIMVESPDEESDDLVPMQVTVPWTTIKEIMSAIVARAGENA